MKSTAAILACSLLSWVPVDARAQEPAVSSGPLLAFTATVIGTPVGSTLLFIAELDGDRVHRLRGCSATARVVARLDRTRLVVAEPERLAIVDLATDDARELVAGDVEFVARHRDHVLFRETMVDGGGRLRRVAWREPGQPEPVGDLAIGAVAVVAGNLVFALAPDEREVFVISLVSLRSRRIWQAPEGTASPRIALAPNGQRLAVGCVDRGFRGILQVLDVATGERLWERRDLPLDLSPLSSSQPTLEVGFEADDHVVCSETRGDARRMVGSFVKVVRTADTGEFVAEEEYAALGLRHELPRPEASAPWFTVARDGERTTLHAVGTDEALASIARAGEQYEDIAVARPGGGYATARLGPTRREFMLFAPGRPPRKLVDGWAHGLVWLPAEGAAGGGR
ncbi:MAG: hypothetical protein KDC98_23600 [Planctomycetes bacterium]|nr:hypothetical protein [Planctomycetota bacterium]